MDCENIYVKKTFLNLPEDKQQRILEEAVREFAENGYQKASLNTIVRRVGIAKGSMYQYFQNKESLFFYVFARFTGLVKLAVRESVATAGNGDFWGLVREVLWAGIRFLDSCPHYFQIYLKVLFESEVPRREELVAQVRLFSMEFFGPLCVEAGEKDQLRRDVPPPMIIFMLDALLDRFLQGYARPYLDGGLGLSGRSREQLGSDVDLIIQVLREGLCPGAEGE